MKIFNYIFVIILLTFICSVNNSHFRYGDIYFDRIGTNEIRIFVSNGWRDTFVDTTTLSVQQPDGSAGVATKIAATNYGTSNGATILRDTYTFTYTQSGVHTFTWSTCCRIYDIENIGGEDWQIQGQFDTSVVDNDYSPAMAIPYIWYFDNSQPTTKNIPILHVDSPSVTYTCSSFLPFDMLPENDIAQPPNQAVFVNSDCTVTVDWSLVDTTIGDPDLDTLWTVGIEAIDSQNNIIRADFFMSPIDDQSVPTCTPASHIEITQSTADVSFTFEMFDLDTTIEYQLFGDTTGFTSNLIQNFPYPANTPIDNTLTYSFVPADLGLNKFGYIQISDGKYYENCIYDVLVFPCIYTPPTLNCPADTVVSSGTTCDAFVNFVATPGIGNCPGFFPDLSNTRTGIIGGLDASDTYTAGTSTSVEFFFQDTLGTSATCSATVTVVDGTDPVITCPSPITLNTGSTVCTADVAAASFTASATDNCGTPTISNDFAPSGGSDAAGTYPFGPNTVIFTATDTATVPNSITCSSTVTVVDATDPVITCPSALSINTDSNVCTGTVAATTFTASATDNCGTPTISNDFAPSGGSDAAGTYPLGPTTVIFTATDSATVPNTDSCSSILTVVDNEDPVPGCTSAFTVTLNLANFWQYTIDMSDIETTHTDNCGIANTVLTGDLNIDFETFLNYFNGDVFTATLTSTDFSGNTGQCSVNIDIDIGLSTSCTDSIFTFPPDNTIEYMYEGFDLEWIANVSNDWSMDLEIWTDDLVNNLQSITSNFQANLGVEHYKGFHQLLPDETYQIRATFNNAISSFSYGPFCGVRLQSRLRDWATDP